MDRKWIAYCKTCQITLEHCPNGNFADAAAKLHKKGHHLYFDNQTVLGGDSNCQVIVGYEFND